MKEIIEKVSSYNLFNYLLPGTLFVFLLEKGDVYYLVQDNIISAAFLYYFIGLSISRIGSIIVEPFLKISGFLHYSDYSKYMLAVKKDSKIELLSEINNTYRTLVTMFIAILFASLFKLVEQLVPQIQGWSTTLLLLALFFLYLFSYKKQTEYIVSRIRGNTRK